MPAVADLRVSGGDDRAAHAIAEAVANHRGWNVDGDVESGAEFIKPSISHDHLLLCAGVRGLRRPGVRQWFCWPVRRMNGSLAARCDAGHTAPPLYSTWNRPRLFRAGPALKAFAAPPLVEGVEAQAVVADALVALGHDAAA